MRFKTLLAAFIMFTATNTTDAQIVKDLLKKTTKKTVEKTGEGVTDKASEKASDKFSNLLKNKIEETQENNQTNENTQQNNEEENTQSEGNSENNSSNINGLGNLMNNLTGNGEKVEYETSYNFDVYIAYKIHTKKPEEPQTEGFIKSYYSNSNDDTAFEMEDANTKQKTIFVADSKNKSMLMLNEKAGKKSGFAMPTEEDSAAVNDLEAYTEEMNTDDSDESVEEYNFTYRKTGRTKKILGYKCTEYQAEDDKSTVLVWTTTELKFASKQGMSKLSEMNGIYTGGAYPNGFVLEMHSVGKEDGSQIDMIVTAIDESASKTISTAGYQLINFNFQNQ